LRLRNLAETFLGNFFPTFLGGLWEQVWGRVFLIPPRDLGGKDLRKEFFPNLKKHFFSQDLGLKFSLERGYFILDRGEIFTHNKKGGE